MSSTLGILVGPDAASLPTSHSIPVLRSPTSGKKAQGITVYLWLTKSAVGKQLQLGDFTANSTGGGRYKQAGTFREASTGTLQSLPPRVKRGLPSQKKSLLEAWVRSVNAWVKGRLELGGGGQAVGH